MSINQIKQSDLKEAQVHFGDLTRRLNFHMKPYVYVKSAKICIFDLAKIISSCRKLPIYLEKILTREKNILFLATKKSTRKLVREQAISCKMPFIVNKWKGGFLTNFYEAKKKIRELQKLTTDMQTSGFSNLIKKEQMAIRKRREKLNNLYEGVVNHNRPDALFIVGLKFEKTAWKEAKKMNLPIIAICNTSYNPYSVDYALPGNDRKNKSINFFVRLMADTIKKNREEKKEVSLS